MRPAPSHEGRDHLEHVNHEGGGIGARRECPCARPGRGGAGPSCSPGFGALFDADGSVSAAGPPAAAPAGSRGRASTGSLAPSGSALVGDACASVSLFLRNLDNRLAQFSGPRSRWRASAAEHRRRSSTRRREERRGDVDPFARKRLWGRGRLLVGPCGGLVAAVSAACRRMVTRRSCRRSRRYSADIFGRIARRTPIPLTKTLMFHVKHSLRKHAYSRKRRHFRN